MTDAFQRAADRASAGAGSPYFFLANLLLVAVYLGYGMSFGFSDGLNVAVTTFLTITTQLIVILVQSSQNKDSRATHLKLDELLRAVAEARTTVARAEEMPREELEARIEAIKEEAQGGESDG